MRLIAAGCLLMLLPGTAQAAWLKASSAHFVVYAEQSESTIRTFSQQLERYNAAMEVVLASKAPVPSPSNRVTVFVVSNEREVRRLCSGDCKFVGGFYIPRAGGSIAIVPRVSTAGAVTGDLEFSMITLLHEYAHHFMISSNPFALPRWASEGGAEFFASAAFARGGGVSLGRPANHRVAELVLARDVTATDLLDPEVYDKRRNAKTYDAFYGKSWLLYHYLVFDKKRAGQFAKYLGLLKSGKSSREAGLEAFGSFEVLERELDAYLHRSTLTGFALPPTMLQIGPVEVSQLSEGEGAMMPLRIRSNRGVNREQALEIVGEARTVAARYPEDAGVLTALAEAEHDAGNDDAAIAAADKAIAIDPGRVNAYVQKGYALFRKAADSGGDVAAYRRARAPFVALNKIEPDNPLTLIYYYQSFARAGVKPPELAIRGIERAVQLAPFDLGLRMTVAMQELRDGYRDAAKSNLTPIAFSPHPNGLSELAQKVLARLDAEPDWKGEGVESMGSDDAKE